MQFRDGIAVQPETLEASRLAVQESLRSIDLEPILRGSIGLIGIGGSLYVATAGAAEMRSRRLRAYGFCPTDLLDFEAGGADAYVALSASGRSLETIEVLKLQKHIPAIGISRDSNNPMSAFVGGVIETRCSFDSSPSAPSYTSMLQAVGLLTDKLTKQTSAPWERLPTEVAEVLAKPLNGIQRACEMLVRRSTIDFVGAGAMLGTALESALIVREAVRIPASAYDTRNFLHGPIESLDERSGLVVLGSGREVQLAQDASDFGCPVVLITSRAAVSEKANLIVIHVPSLGGNLTDAILHMLPVQRLVAELADHTGLADAKFRYRQNDTKVM